MTLDVVLASHNAHKITEFQKILGRDVPDIAIEPYDGPEPIEDGVSFDENALIKARAAAAHTGRIALADDSGISVDIMGGAPGIFSARWSGTRKDDENRRLLLAQLADIGDAHRAATFHCAIAIVDPKSGLEQVARGEWPGRVAHHESGDHGFGYDPIFVPEGYTVSSAELAPDEKNEISHRARAFRAAVPILQAL
ncbi:RdgB/HAM1 family non-canonical purine NTP pyrophosphatase [Microbacterium sp. MPKO10]|uniref:RdgB/HAM1 family non-canonical purine NTP pyrophosphatase n=1 Tax=Microbacterium sp. MPKO10 TaxID=2989818 RepID=UPI002235C9D8|nr:RdgB/HAM1 family non-canonical purine NTP pyrophosphatase [Microbacterium sp. MPKO10]MCW4458136.1 RdgB/HAM1 family non-canonical purine NTP pyrophosphatase [Microbacterium sp. MPKO10]